MEDQQTQVYPHTGFRSGVVSLAKMQDTAFAAKMRPNGSHIPGAGNVQPAMRHRIAILGYRRIGLTLCALH